MLNVNFNSVHFSQNCIFAGFFASLASFNTQIKFSMKIFFGFTRIYKIERRSKMADSSSSFLVINDVTMTLMLLLEVLYMLANFLILSNTY